MASPKKIGEGSYGCIHKPSLKCVGTDLDPSNEKVSKIIDTKNANIELNEFDKIARIDKFANYHLGKPGRCSPARTPENLKAIKKCSNSKTLIDDLGNSLLLVMKDGGEDLNNYAKIVKKMPVDEEHKRKNEKFWIECHRILRGIRLFLKHGLVHHDMKPHNIVYNESENRINIIDFGLMVNLTDTIKDATDSNYGFPNPHWNFPLENIFYDFSDFNILAKQTEKKKTKFVHNNIFKNKDFTFTAKIVAEFVSSEDDTKYENILYDFHDMVLDTEFNPKNYYLYLSKSLNTFDIYGTGISFLYMLLNSEHLMESEVVNKFRVLFEKMITPFVLSRIQIDQLIVEYENLLGDVGFLQKHNKSFANHILLDTKKEDPEIKEPELSKNEIDKIIIEDPVKVNSETKKGTSSKTKKNPYRKFFGIFFKTKSKSQKKTDIINSRRKSRTPNTKNSMVKSYNNMV